MYKFVVLVAVVFMVGCSTTSLSNAGYQRGNYQGENNALFLSSAELEELEVLGISTLQSDEPTSIEDLLFAAKPISIAQGSRVMLVQSGAEFPDGDMVQSVSKYWDISVLSGDRRRYADANIHQTFRRVAASGGHEYLLIYWGVVERSEMNLHTKSVSWVPFVGWSLPDETVGMRLVVKFALIDVASGQWSTFMSEPIEEEFMSSVLTRNGKNQRKEIELKKELYEQAVVDLFSKYGS